MEPHANQSRGAGLNVLRIQCVGGPLDGRFMTVTFPPPPRICFPLVKDGKLGRITYVLREKKTTDGFIEWSYH